jgi:tRNA (guanine37-N1)-methyltransferase
MQIDIVSIFPDIFSALHHGVIGRALHKKAATLRLWNPRDYADNKRGYIDSRPAGGGPGMLMQAPPLDRCIQAISNYRKQHKLATAKVWMLCPSGRPLEQSRIPKLLEQKDFILICGRYEGIDQRFIDTRVDARISIGDYVLSGGELPAMVLLDTLLRAIPETLGNRQSYLQDSFQNNCLDYPNYCKPDIFSGQSIPNVLKHGNHADISAWRAEQAMLRTQKLRPNLGNRQSTKETAT